MAGTGQDTFLAQSVATLDLRGVKGKAQQARRTVMQQRREALSSLGVVAAMPRPSTAGVRTKSAAASNLGNSQALLSDRQASTSAAEAAAELAKANAKVQALEGAMVDMCARFASYVFATETKDSEYYSVSFGPGAIGMILSQTEEGSVDVAELRDDASGRPLLAKACGKVAVGDSVIAIANHVLSRHGPPTLNEVANEFKSNPRPVSVLFKRNK